jgi:hypothetical protein
MRRIEALGMCGIVAIAAILLLPLFSERRAWGQAAYLLESGRELASDLYMFPHTERGYIGGEARRLAIDIPSERYKTSTEYFREIVRNGMMADYHLYGGGGVPIYRGKDASQFTAKYNAWEVVADNRPPGAFNANDPLLVTRNNRAKYVDEMSLTNLESIAPLGHAGVVIVMRDGRAYFEDQSIGSVITDFKSVHRKVLPP